MGILGGSANMTGSNRLNRMTRTTRRPMLVKLVKRCTGMGRRAVNGKKTGGGIDAEGKMVQLASGRW